MTDKMKKTGILIWTGNFRTNLSARLQELDGVNVMEASTEEEAAEKLSKSEIFIASAAIWSRHLSDAIKDSGEIKWLQLLNAGYDNVLADGIPQHVILSTIGELGSDTVAEHAVAMLLSLLRQFPHIISSSNDTLDIHDLGKIITTLRGKEITVFGFGHIGRKISRLLACFGTNVHIIAKNRRYDSELGVQIYPQNELDTFLNSSDVLIICAPLNDETRSAISKSAFEAMKPGCYVVNVSRGAIVDTEALTASLKNGKIAGAALDVTDPEPLRSDHPLMHMPNVFITPHIAWAGDSEWMKDQLEQYIVENVNNYIAGGNINNAI